jgi:predicted nucleotidyltransferase
MNHKRKEDLNNEIVKRLKPLKPLKIILFGSYAYGAPTKNSDIDICIVKENVKSKIKEKRKARRLLKDISLAKDILIPSKSEYDFYKNEYGSVYMDIDKKGKLLWPNT